MSTYMASLILCNTLRRGHCYVSIKNKTNKTKKWISSSQVIKLSPRCSAFLHPMQKSVCLFFSCDTMILLFPPLRHLPVKENNCGMTLRPYSNGRGFLQSHLTVSFPCSHIHSGKMQGLICAPLIEDQIGIDISGNHLFPQTLW